MFEHLPATGTYVIVLQLTPDGGASGPARDLEIIPFPFDIRD
jgi:hypothetical protein